MLRQKLYRVLLWTQGIYTFLTAAWPIIDIESFLFVTGYKTDIWLVKTVSILLLVISIVLLFSTPSFKQVNYQVALLALLVAIGMAYVDFYYSLNKTISKIYMADGFVEIVFVVGWLIVLKKIPPRRDNIRR